MPLSDTEQKELYWLEVFEALLKIYETSEDEANQNRAKQIAWLLDYQLNLGPPVEAIFHLAENEGPISSSLNTRTRFNGLLPAGKS